MIPAGCKLVPFAISDCGGHFTSKPQKVVTATNVSKWQKERKSITSAPSLHPEPSSTLQTFSDRLDDVCKVDHPCGQPIQNR